MSLMPSRMMRYFTPLCAMHVAVEAGERAGAVAVVQNAVAADALVQHAEVRGLLVGLEARGEDVGPAAVGVAGGVRAIGDGVAEGDDGGGFGVGASRRFL